MTSQENGKSANLQSDVVIVGGGGAGLAAASSAVENGSRKVILLEKMGSPGGSTAMAHDIFGVESPVQKRAWFDTRRDDFFKIAMEWAHWSGINPRIVRAFIDKSGDTIRWLEAQGVNFSLLPMYPNQAPLVRHSIEGRGPQLIRLMRKHCEDLGVKILTRTRARKILRDEDGNAAGVLAENKDGQVRVNAQSVIMAAGGYGNNKEMLKKYLPNYHDNMTYDGPRSNTGDGILMAIEAGAATASLGMANLHGPGMMPQKNTDFLHIDTDDSAGQPLQMMILPVCLEPDTLWVNKRGIRFINECYILQFFAYGHAVAQQPDGIAYTLFDKGKMQAMEKEGIYNQMAPHWFPPDTFTPLPGLERELRKQPADVVKIANSWDEMAQWMEINPPVLKATIDEYNSACDKGYDPLLGKDRRYLQPLRRPPYYAIKGHVCICDTMGGIKINENMEVLDSGDKPIPGLFAAGVMVGGWESENYNYHLTGHLLGFALNSGRIAGEMAAKYTSRKS